jgi:hypothetical protein
MRLGSPSPLRPVVLGAALGSLLLVATQACLPDPKGDYEDFIARTATFDAGVLSEQTSDSAPFDSKPPDTTVEALYVGICVTALAANDPNQALRFYTESQYTPDGPGAATGKVKLTITPMVGWDVNAKQPIVPATISKTETRGSAIDVAEFAVGADGRFTANLGTINLVKEANSISGRDAVIENSTLNGLYSAGDRFCSTLAGLLTKPYSFTFDPAQNTCLFQKVKEGDPTPKIPSGDFVCKL